MNVVVFFVYAVLALGCTRWRCLAIWIGALRIVCQETVLCFLSARCIQSAANNRQFCKCAAEKNSRSSTVSVSLHDVLKGPLFHPYYFHQTPVPCGLLTSRLSSAGGVAISQFPSVTSTISPFHDLSRNYLWCLRVLLLSNGSRTWRIPNRRTK